MGEMFVASRAVPNSRVTLILNAALIPNKAKTISPRVSYYEIARGLYCLAYWK
jgi:hypothetical protein